LVNDERPLETTGFLVSSDMVVAMDPCIHPRFIKRTRVIVGGENLEAAPAKYFKDQWGFALKLAHPVANAKPFVFKAAGARETLLLANYYRQDGDMIRTLVPLTGQRAQLPDGKTYLLAEHEGLAIRTDGQPAGLVLSHRLPSDTSWQGSPLGWPAFSSSEMTALFDNLKAAADGSMIRVKLRFRSPKNVPGQMRERLRQSRAEEEEGEGTVTERDVLGIVLPGGKIVILANLKPNVTARLEHIDLYAQGESPLPGKFVATLRDYGVLVAESEKSLPHSIPVDSTDPAFLMAKLMLRADISLQGENRAAYYYTARIAGVRVGPRMDGFPELADPEIQDAFLFTPDLKLSGLPCQKRERPGGLRDPLTAIRTLTPARLIANAVSQLPATADLANVPVPESEENRLAWLGVELQPLTRELARANGVADQTHDGQSGALVTFVHPDSPAAKAGIFPGAVLLRLIVPRQPYPIEVVLEEDYARSQAFPWDRLDEIREQYFDRIPTPWPAAENSFTRSLTDFGFGTKYTAEFSIDGKLEKKVFEVVAAPVHYESAPKYKAESVGLTVKNLTYEVRRYLQRKVDEPGVIVSKVEAGSRASVAGVKPYEVITHVNDKAVSNVKEFEEMAAGGGELKLSLKRMAKGRIVTIKPASGT
jgi:hypothetical protein